VHASVGTAGAYRGDFLACDLAERALEGVLHAAAGWLGLPAAKGAAVVFDAERDSHRNFCNSKTKLAAPKCSQSMIQGAIPGAGCAGFTPLGVN
jgi:hypothetical protein